MDENHPFRIHIPVIRQIFQYARSSPRRGLTLLMILMGPLNLILGVLPFQMALFFFVVGWFLFLTEGSEEEEGEGEEVGQGEESEGLDFLEPVEFFSPDDQEEKTEGSEGGASSRSAGEDPYSSGSPGSRGGSPRS